MSAKVQSENVRKEHQFSVRASWKLTFSEFLNETSLHGCKNISTSRSILHRSFWGIIVLSMAAALIYSLIKFYSEYRQYKVTTRATKEFRKEIPFPTVVVCNQSPFDLDSRNLTDVELRFLQASGSAGVLFPQIDWNGPDGDALDQVDYPAFWEQGSASVRSMIKLLAFKNKIYTNFSIAVIRNFGAYCFAFNAPSLDSDLKVESVSNNAEGISLMIDAMQYRYVPGISYNSGVKVFIYDAQTSHLLEADSAGVGTGSSVTILLQRKEISFLGQPYNSRGADCADVNSPNFVNPLRWTKYYSYTGCVTECANKRAMEVCNCTAAWQPLGVDVNLRNCSIKEASTCYLNHFVDTMVSSRCQCLHPCEMVIFDIQASSQSLPTGSSVDVLANVSGFTSAKYMRENVLIFQVKYRSMIVDKAVHEPELLLDDMFGRVGGQMGLFLGASLITISELVQFILVGIIKTVKRLSGEKRNVHNKN